MGSQHSCRTEHQHPTAHHTVPVTSTHVAPRRVRLVDTAALAEEAAEKLAGDAESASAGKSLCRRDAALLQRLALRAVAKLGGALDKRRHTDDASILVVLPTLQQTLLCSPDSREDIRLTRIVTVGAHAHADFLGEVVGVEGFGQAEDGVRGSHVHARPHAHQARAACKRAAPTLGRGLGQSTEHHFHGLATEEMGSGGELVLYVGDEMIRGWRQCRIPTRRSEGGGDACCRGGAAPVACDHSIACPCPARPSSRSVLSVKSLRCVRHSAEPCNHPTNLSTEVFYFIRLQGSGVKRRCVKMTLTDVLSGPCHGATRGWTGPVSVRVREGSARSHPTPSANVTWA